MHRFLATAALLLCAFTPAAHASETAPSPMIKLAAGYFDVFDDYDAAVFRVDLRGNQQWFGHVDPFATLSVNSEGGVYGGVGLTGDLHLAPRWVLTPSFAAGLYGRGDSKDLGGPIEFRSGIEVAYKFQNDTRLGVELAHTSNAHVYDSNPGMETVMLTYALPVGWILP